MKIVLLASVLALLAALASTSFVRPEWAFDAGVFHAFLGALAIIMALAANSVIARRRGTGNVGFFGPGLLTVSQAFCVSMAINIVCGGMVMHFGSARQGPDTYAIGFGALIPAALVAIAVLTCLIFAMVKWWPVRLIFATLSGCTAAFACMAITWWR